MPRLRSNGTGRSRLGALADRQPQGTSGTIRRFMKELLQQIDPDYYRSVQLVIAHTELKQLRQWRIGVKRRSKIPLGMCRSPDSSHLVSGRAATVQSLSAEVTTHG